MSIRTSDAEWQGTIREGRGHMRFGGGAYDGAYSWASRFSDGGGTNPEELIAAAHAGCFSMALAAELTKAGFSPVDIRTTAALHFDQVDGAPTIALIALTTGGRGTRYRQGNLREDRRRRQGELPGVAGAGRGQDHAGRHPQGLKRRFPAVFFFRSRQF
ncbi:MAG: OsmC family peroxiredoxin [Bauldia sp.]